MQLAKEDVFKVEVLTVKEFCQKYGEGVTKEAIYYAIKNKLVDHIPLGRDNFIVMTDYTRQYRPNQHRARLLNKTKRKKTV